MKLIPLNKGRVARVDDQDIDYLMQWKWRTLTNGYQVYAFRTDGKRPNRKTVLMHRQLLGFPKSQIDHIDFDGLNNQRNNLRLATASQNNAHKPKGKGVSRFKGVFYRPDQRKHWCAGIWFQNKRILIGSYHDEVSAALAYNQKAEQLFGSFAVLNIICSPH